MDFIVLLYGLCLHCQHNFFNTLSRKLALIALQLGSIWNVFRTSAFFSLRTRTNAEIKITTDK